VSEFVGGTREDGERVASLTLTRAAHASRFPLVAHAHAGRPASCAPVASATTNFLRLSWDCVPPFDMCGTCAHVQGMAVMVQIRHVPDDIHRRLKVRATQSGMTLSEFSCVKSARSPIGPRSTKWSTGIRRRRRLAQSVDSAALVRAERETRR